MSTPGSFVAGLPSVEFNTSRLEFWFSKVFLMQDRFPTVCSTTALIAALTILSSTVVVLRMLVVDVVVGVVVDVVVVDVVVDVIVDVVVVFVVVVLW